MESWRLNSANSRSQVQSSTSDDDDDGPPPLVDDSDSDDSHSHRSPFDNDYDCLPPLIDDSDSDDLQDDEIFSISASNAQARPRDGLRSIVEIMQVYYGAIRDVYGSSDDDDDDPPPLVDDSAFSDSEGHQRLLHHTESHIPYPLDRLRLSMVGNNFPHLMDFKRASREAVRNLPRFTMTPTISCDSSDTSQEDQTITPTTMSTTTGNNFKGSDSDCDGAHDTWKDFCALCLSKVIEGEQFTKLPCGHIFHIRPDADDGPRQHQQQHQHTTEDEGEQGCSGITKWLERSNECPLCRHQLPTASPSVDPRFSDSQWHLWSPVSSATAVESESESIMQRYARTNAISTDESLGHSP